MGSLGGFKNCEWLSLSQTYLRLLLARVSTYSYCTQRFRVNHIRH